MIRVVEDQSDEVRRLRAELDQARQDADRTLFRVTRVAKVITALGRPRDAAVVAPAAEVAELFSCDVGMLLIGPDDQLRIDERWGVTLDVMADAPISLPADLARSIERDTVVVGPAETTPLMAPLATLGVRHVAWVRLVVDDGNLGFLLLARRADVPFTGSDAHELRAIGQRIALSIDNSRLHARTAQQVLQLRRLVGVGTQLAGTTDAPAAGTIVVEALRDVAPSASVAVYRRDGDGWTRIAGDTTGWPRVGLPSAGGGVDLVPLRDFRREVGCIATRRFPQSEESRQLLDHLTDVAGLALSKILLHERTTHQARHDALTGLVNRVLLRERVERALAEGRDRVALLFCDLDRFKLVNDQLGHDAGDQLLVEVAGRLLGAVRAEDTVARLGGDEFVVLCTDVRVPGDALEIAERIGRAVRPPIEIAGRTVTISTSQGVVVPTSDSTADTLLRDADAAMYRAKARGRDRHELFDASFRIALDARAAIERDVRDALRNGRLRAVYQPLVGLDTGAMRAVEALLRYVDDDGHLVAAGEFIEIAEESDLIVELGTWMIGEAVSQMAVWRDRFGAAAPPRVLINVASRQLVAALPDAVAGALARHDLPAAAIALELTESAIISSGDEVLACLAALRRMGVEVGIDDFGTGYSSLTYLKRFPVDFVKIDREFVQGMVEETEDASIVDAIVRLTEALGLQTVAEGVETREQRDQLVGLGCEMAQGYLFSRPLTAAQLEERLVAGDLVATSGPVRQPPLAAVAAVPAGRW